MSLSGQQVKQLQDAMIDAFINKASLEQMLLFQLNKNLREIAGEGSLKDIVFKLIQTANAEGWVEDLIRAAAEFNPGNQKLRAISQELLTDKTADNQSYDNWRTKKNKQFLECLNSESKSRATFGQAVNVFSEDLNFIERTALVEKLNNWYSNWLHHKCIFTILGQEGDGKTWGVSYWLGLKIKEDSCFPSVIFLSSNTISNNDPLALFCDIFVRDLNLQYEHSKKYVEQWFNNSDNIPKVIIILDGINQHREHSWWRQLLDKISDEWLQHIALIVTCRSEYWTRKFNHLDYLQIQAYAIEPYSDTELVKALNYNKQLSPLNLNSLSNNLLNLLRKPRYLNLMLKHYRHIESSGDITVERLIYEDWKDRLRIRNLPLDDEQFKSLIRDLAKEVRETNNQYLRDKEIEANLSFISNKNDVFQELITGGILRNSGNKSQITPEFLQYGFGLLLVDRLQSDIERNNRNPEEIIAEWIEPQAEMDIKAKICHYASLIALTDPRLPVTAKTALLKAWINNLNPGQDIEKEFIAYLPCDPLAYIKLAEIICSDTHINSWAEELLKQAFVKWNNYKNILNILSSAIEKWLGFICYYGFSSQRHFFVNKEELREQINKRAGHELEPGTFMFSGYNLTVIEARITENNGLLRLGRLALTLISCLPTQNFIKAITIGIIAEEIMGVPDKNDLFNWVFRTACNSLFSSIEAEVNTLLTSQSDVIQNVVYRLLSYEGSQEAYKFLKKLSADSFSATTHDSYQSYIQWDESICENCIRGFNLELESIAAHLKPFCINPGLRVPNDFGERIKSLAEKISTNSIWSTFVHDLDDHKYDDFEPVLCIYAPDSIVHLIKKITRDITQRSGIALRQLSLKTLQNYLVFGSEEKDSIYQVWKNFKQKCNTYSKLDDIAEGYLFYIIIKDLNPSEQLTYILDNDNMACYPASIERIFKPIQNIKTIISSFNNQIEQIEKLKRLLWFISTHQKNLDLKTVNDDIYPLIENKDSFLRSLVLKIIYKCNDIEIIQRFINSNWTWNIEYNDNENHWGSLILGKNSEDLSYSLLANCVCPVYLAHIVCNRNMQVDEVSQYTNFIHSIWLKFTTELLEIYKLSDDFPPAEVKVNLTIINVSDCENTPVVYISENNFSQSTTFFSENVIWGMYKEKKSAKQMVLFQNANIIQTYREELNNILIETRYRQFKNGNYLFCEIIPINLLIEMLSHCPNLINEWLNPIESQYININNKSEDIVQLMSTFYQNLCFALLKINDRRAIYLYKYLRKTNMKITIKDLHTNISFLDYIIFQTNSSSNIENEWEILFNSSYSDLELMHLTIAVQQGSALNWLHFYLETKLNSSAPLDFSRGVSILGFLDNDFAFNFLNQLYDEQPDTWRKDVVKISLNRWHINSWAKHWFDCFINANDNTIAWSSFRLFLRCVDNRFWLWKDKLTCNNLSENALKIRLDFLENNMNEVKNTIRNREKELKEYFLCYKIAQEIIQDILQNKVNAVNTV